MREMKDSGVEWIGEIPTDWESRKIKYIATLAGRIGWQGLTSDEYSDEGAYLITGINFKNGIIDWNSCVHVPMSRWEEATQIQIKSGDLLITKDGTVGKVAIAENVPAETSLNSGVLLIRNNDECDTRFLFWIIQSEVFWKWFSLINAGNSTIIHLYQQDFYNFAFPFPVKGEQKRLADYLDSKCSKIDEIIEKQQKIIEKLKEYKLSVITEAVTKGLNPDAEMKDSGVDWIGVIPHNCNISKLKYVVEFHNGDRGANYPSGEDLVDEGIAFLSSNNIHGMYVDIKYVETKYITDERYNILGGAKLKINDIVFCLRGSIGICAINKFLTDGTIASSLVVIRPKKISPDFLNYLLHSNVIYGQSEIYMNGTCAANLSAQNLGNYMFVEHDLNVQQEIVNYLDDVCEKLDSKIKNADQICEKLKEYKKSLIYEVVTGKKEV